MGPGGRRHGTIGITDHAQQELGDIVYVDLPKPGARVEQGKSLGSVESVKAFPTFTPRSRAKWPRSTRCWPTRPKS
jgi:glycine cleavage system H lipoate-binding protein